MAGIFTVSLDFELYWGVRDQRSLESYRANLLGVREAVPRLLELFEQEDVRATWATVGLLFCESKEELLARCPEERPRYVDRKLDPYANLDAVGKGEREDPFHFAPSLIEAIRHAPGQEIGTHTFSHYYALEEGQDMASFTADLRAAVDVARARGIALRSLVFPRNQVRRDYLPACLEAGITAFRGTEPSRLYSPRPWNQEKLPQRAGRLADAYLPLVSGAQPATPGRPLDVPSSRFLRPYSPGAAPLDGLRLRRIVSGVRAAADRDGVYHLWWHPHNFGANTEENLSFLRRVLTTVRELRADGRIECLSMGDLAERA